MKRILITGANSYIGTMFERYVAYWPERYRVDTIDVRDDSWRAISFSGYDSVFCVAGIAHIKETEQNRELFYTVNRDLAVDVAKKAKTDGVPQFIYLSSMSVYGIDKGKIDERTVPLPKSAYGDSKYQAELLLQNLADEGFKIALLRPPMVYGKGCKGNFQTLVRFVHAFPLFPQYDNKRSMIFIDNLSSFVKMLIDERRDGLFYPQNAEYVSTSIMVKQICAEIGKSMYFIRFFNFYIKISRLKIVNKVFSDLYYDKSMSIPINYEIDFLTSIKRSVEGDTTQ